MPRGKRFEPALAGGRESAMHTKSATYLAAGAFAWMTVGAAWAQETGGRAAPMPGQMVGQLVSGSATVQKVDLAKRELTLKAKDGKPFMVSVPERVQNLENLKPGDQINVDYYQSLSMSMEKPGAAPMAPRIETFRQPSTGTLPGGLQGQQITGTVKITKIDSAKNEITIEGPSGQTDTVTIKDPQQLAMLKKLKVGDQIQLTYSEAVLVSMTPAKGK
jgi:Cu/Ag efflux protein CusF